MKEYAAYLRAGADSKLVILDIEEDSVVRLALDHLFLWADIRGLSDVQLVLRLPEGRLDLKCGAPSIASK